MTLSFAAHSGLSLLSRLLAAVLGGYALASALALWLGAVLPAPVPKPCWPASSGALRPMWRQ